MTEPLLRPEEAAAELRITVQTLRRWVKRGWITPHRYNPRVYRYTRAEVEAAKRRARDAGEAITKP